MGLLSDIFGGKRRRAERERIKQEQRDANHIARGAARPRYAEGGRVQSRRLDDDEIVVTGFDASPAYDYGYTEPERHTSHHDPSPSPSNDSPSSYGGSDSTSTGSDSTSGGGSDS